MSTETLRTGDIKKFSSDNFFTSDNWAVVFEDTRAGAFGSATRQDARNSKALGERIGKILNRTKKTVTVEITK